MAGNHNRSRRSRGPARPAAVLRTAATTAEPGPVGTDLQEGVRGAWRGFLVLFFGELLTPLAAQLSPALGSLWLSLVGAAGFAVAGIAIGRAPRPVVQGAAVALGALALTMPLRMLTHDRLSLLSYVVSFAFAVVVGGASGLIAGRHRKPV
jgi:hypothetical protein